MKRIFLLVLVLGAGCLGLKAQTSWSATSLDGNTYRNGNVGIGTNSPFVSLDIKSTSGATRLRLQSLINQNSLITFTPDDGSINQYNLGYNDLNNVFSITGASFPSELGLHLLQNGNIGVGTTNPNSWFTGRTFEVMGDRPVIKLNSSNLLSTILFTNGQIDNTHYGEFHLNHLFNATEPTYSLLSFNSYPSQGILNLRADGNVGIGTTSPNSKLEVNGVLRLGSNSRHLEFNPNCELQSFDGWLHLNRHGGNIVAIGYDEGTDLLVNGTIRAEEIKVETGWADFVFHPTYNLRPLQEVNTYIQQNGHLPEIPTAKEVEENGVSLGEMNAKLLQKIEELTLYVIELNKKVQELENQNKINNEK